MDKTEEEKSFVYYTRNNIPCVMVLDMYGKPRFVPKEQPQKEEVTK